MRKRGKTLGAACVLGLLIGGGVLYSHRAGPSNPAHTQATAMASKPHWVLHEARGASKLRVSADGTQVVAEIPDSNEDAPPHLLVLDLATQKTTRHQRGWLVAAPGREQPGWYLTNTGPTATLRLASFANTESPWRPPPGTWLFAFGEPVGDAVVLGLLRMQEAPESPIRTSSVDLLHLAVVNPQRGTAQIRLFDLRDISARTLVRRYFLTVGPGHIFVAESFPQQPSNPPQILVAALDPKTLETRWSRALIQKSGSYSFPFLSAKLAVEVGTESLVAIVGGDSLRGVDIDHVDFLDMNTGNQKSTLYGPDIRDLWIVTDITSTPASGIGVNGLLSSYYAGRRNNRWLGIYTMSAKTRQVLHEVIPLPSDDPGELAPFSVGSPIAYSQTFARWLLVPRM